jgi:hypothetical protein
MKQTIHIARSFKEAGERDIRQYKSMTPEERLDILQRLREVKYLVVGGFP